MSDIGGKDFEIKKFRIGAFVLFFSLPACCFGQGLSFQGLPSLSSLTDNVKVNPYAQVGFQWLGANLNLPVENEVLTSFLNIGPMDISLKDANFWTGIAGITVTANEKLSVFAAAGGIPNRSFITSATVPVSLGPLSNSSDLYFTKTHLESWFIQTGIGLGPVLLGLYWNHLGFSLSDPRVQNGPIANQTLRGDILSKTFAPFIGIALPSGGAMLTVAYSPFAYSDTALALMNSRRNLSESRYTWNRPGNLLNAMLQYNTPVWSSTTIGLWCNYSWMWMRQGAHLTYENTPFPAVTRSRDVTATMTQYVVGGGVSVGINF